MKENQKDAFQIKLEKETRKQLIKHNIPIVLVAAAILFTIPFIAPRGCSVIEIMENFRMFCITIVIILTLIIFYHSTKYECKAKAYNKVVKELSEDLAEQVITLLVQGSLAKVKNDIYGGFSFDFEDIKEFYLALEGEGEDEFISIYAVLKGEKEKRQINVISKEEFSYIVNFVRLKCK